MYVEKETTVSQKHRFVSNSLYNKCIDRFFLNKSPKLIMITLTRTV